MQMWTINEIRNRRLKEVKGTLHTSWNKTFDHNRALLGEIILSSPMERSNTVLDYCSHATEININSQFKEILFDRIALSMYRLCNLCVKWCISLSKVNTMVQLHVYKFSLVGACQYCVGLLSKEKINGSSQVEIHC